MFHIDKEHLFPSKTEGKKEEGLRGSLVDVSQGFQLVVLVKSNCTIIYNDLQV
jgi:hypothetical protein